MCPFGRSSCDIEFLIAHLMDGETPTLPTYSYIVPLVTFHFLFASYLAILATFLAKGNK